MPCCSGEGVTLSVCVWSALMSCWQCRPRNTASSTTWLVTSVYTFVAMALLMSWSWFLASFSRSHSDRLAQKLIGNRLQLLFHLITVLEGWTILKLCYRRSENPTNRGNVGKNEKVGKWQQIYNLGNLRNCRQVAYLRETVNFNGISGTVANKAMWWEVFDQCLQRSQYHLWMSPATDTFYGHQYGHPDTQELGIKHSSESWEWNLTAFNGVIHMWFLSLLIWKLWMVVTGIHIPSLLFELPFSRWIWVPRGFLPLLSQKQLFGDKQHRFFNDRVHSCLPTITVKAITRIPEFVNSIYVDSSLENSWEKIWENIIVDFGLAMFNDVSFLVCDSSKLFFKKLWCFSN